MPWIAPDVVRPTLRRPADERTYLDGLLDRQRATLMHKCAQLTGEQLTRRPVPSSRLTLLGLVRHLAETEQVWFMWRFAGVPVEFLYQTEETPEASFDLVDPAQAEEDFRIYHSTIGLIRSTVAGRRLDETFVFGRDRRPCDLRYVYLHMIEEYARHNGHADMIRELLDGEVGH
ncbi:MAG: DinB family protein [Actinomycetota bacterium]|nr:DinB family protein [Actinomycetota bacterium]